MGCQVVRNKSPLISVYDFVWVININTVHLDSIHHIGSSATYETNIFYFTQFIYCIAQIIVLR